MTSAEGAAAAGVAPVAARSLRNRLADHVPGLLLVAPGVLWLAIFFIAPLGIIFVVSLAHRDAANHIVFENLGFHNYAEATRPEYIPAFLNSVKYAAISTLLCIGLGYPIAYWISRHGGSRKVLLLILVMLPFWTSYLIRTYAWMIILRDNGVLNGALQTLGVIDQPLILLNTDISVIVGMTYGFLPFAILPLFVSIDRLDDNLVQAARDLYASGRAAFLHVTLPLTMPGVIAASLLTFIPAIGDYVTPDLLGGAQTTTAAKIIQVIFTGGENWPYGSALGFVLMLVSLAGTFLALRTLRRETFS